MDIWGGAEVNVHTKACTINAPSGSTINGDVTVNGELTATEGLTATGNVTINGPLTATAGMGVTGNVAVTVHLTVSGLIDSHDALSAGIAATRPEKPEWAAKYV